MRKHLLFCLALALTTLGFSQTNHIVETVGLTFSPFTTTIEVGDTVTWVNTSMGTHNVNGSTATFPDNPEGFANGAAASGNWTFQHVFTIPGSYGFQCDPHASLNMVGAIIVNDNNSGGNPEIVISEIMYNPPETGTDSLEFIELYNNGSSDVNLLGYTFTQGIEFTFLSGYNLGTGEYVMIASDSAAFENNYGLPAFQFVDGSLSNGGEDIVLYDDMGALIDSVDYDDSFPWPGEADGNGASLVLCDIDSDNIIAENWAAANTSAGFSIDGFEVFANPGGASNCPSGAIVRFLETTGEASEGDGTVQIGVEISGSDGAEYAIDVLDQPASTATVGADLTYAPTTLIFVGEAVDTQYVTVTLIDDPDIESVELLILELNNPSADLSVDGVNSVHGLAIEDNDATIADIVITEIMYSPPGSDAMYEYMELYNNGTSNVDLEGYYFSEGIVDTLPAIVLAPDEYLLLVADSAAIDMEFGLAGIEWQEGGLSNSGEDIELRDALGNVVDYVNYMPGGGWPEEANGDGPALVLCDPSDDNEGPTNWSAAVELTGVIISGTELLGSPGAVNDCTPPPPVGYTAYTIGEVTGNDADGEADSLGVRAELTGVIYGVNLRPGGLQFTLIDANNDGIATFSNSDDFGYTVVEGDEVTVQGTISQFSGLTQINLDTVILNSAGNTLVDPTIITELGEDTESQLVTLQGIEIVEMVEAGGGINVTVTPDGGTTTTIVRVDLDTEITENDLIGYMGQVLIVTGLGGQFDSNSPFDEGYQLLPRYLADIDIVESTNEPEWASEVGLSPVPTRELLTVTVPLVVDRLVLVNSIGQQLDEWAVNNNRIELDVQAYPAGIYHLILSGEGGQLVRKFIKL